ncbi:type VI secretion system protein ImpF [Andreprevotia lacus DSM 23236]|jgi:type VI secretion system protein ImpF|uniref:Type VI secretion system protein ImpF n=1 Tax=Andreprevotia lacus DSM 23236 TaxID=1121001 RepID=A0A1W1XGE4_9NEIS|nr:type VI secretion system baseplate subunit TssE [Andreprevotia lacus]SMC22862.1 type VI secretion system protein ImpF [Andreprevotia lacus DSM 23236]
MQSRPQTIRITPSLLDRLFDDAPDEVIDDQPTFRQGLEQLKQSVARDLEGLLNTRADSVSDLAAYPELSRSVVAYGLPDFSALSAASETDRARIRAEISSVIARFESRLIQVQVHLVPRDGELNQFSFHIEALLRVDPVPEPVVFDAVLEVATQLYKIE